MLTHRPPFLAFFLGLAFGLVAQLPGSALAEHGDHDPDSIHCYSSAQQQMVFHEPPAPLNRLGSSSTTLTIGADPHEAKLIVRSIYIWRDSGNMIEFGWKWRGNPSFVLPDDWQGKEDLDTGPTVFTVKAVGGRYTISEGIDSSNPGWGTLARGVDRGFKIVRSSTDPTDWKLWRTDGTNWLHVGYWANPNVTSGAVYAGAEAKSPCDSLKSHFFNLERRNGAGDWGPWDEDKKAPNLYDKSRWFYWYPSLNATDNSWILHCATDGCPDAD